VHRGGAAVAGGPAADRAKEADGAVAGRTRLGGDEVPGEAAGPAVRDGQRPDPRRPALPGRRARRGAAPHRAPPAGGKSAGRTGGRVLAASLVLLALVGGIIGTTAGMLHAKQRRTEAEEAQGREAEQRSRAEQARDRTRQALDAMTSSVTGDSLTTQKALSA